jgi:hypothetical protein
LRAIGAKARYRDPDSLKKPSEHLVRLYPDFQKVAGARSMAPYLSYRRNKSTSFRALIDGIARIGGQRPVCG